MPGTAGEPAAQSTLITLLDVAVDGGDADPVPEGAALAGADARDDLHARHLLRAPCAEAIEIGEKLSVAVSA